MTTEIEVAQAALEAAQAKLHALSRIPQTDDLPNGTVLIWKKGNDGKVSTSASVKRSGRWHHTGIGTGNYADWSSFVRYLTANPNTTRLLTLERVDEDGVLVSLLNEDEPEPPVKVGTGEAGHLTITYQGVTWEFVQQGTISRPGYWQRVQS